MKDLQCFLLFLLLLLISLLQNAVGRRAKVNTSHRDSYDVNSPRHQTTSSRQHKADGEYQHKQREFSSAQPHSLELEVDTLPCPVGCVCQYAHFMDLPIARWINHMEGRRPEKAAAHFQERASDEEELINDNETAYEGEDGFLSNPYIKQATCLLQEDNNFEELVQTLPHDLQALIVLYTGFGRNKTVTTSTLKPLNQLTTLEIRGPQDRSFRLLFDEPLSFVQNANFDSITLMGSDSFKRPKTTAHPRESFDYKPKIELDFYATELQSDPSDATRQTSDNSKNKYSNVEQDDFWDDEIEILPYDVYLQEVRKARIPTFYGWQHLEVLRIQSCHLKELHWEMFDGLDALQHLSLERNAIEVVTALALFGSSNIRTLSLAHNAIQDLHYRALGGLLQLELLDLSDNKLTKLSEMSFPPFPKLARADFHNNPIRFIFPATFGVMNNTRSLHFGSREAALELWNNEPFEWLDKLRELNLENVSIANLEHHIFQGLNSLEVLRVKGSIRRIEFDAFAGQSELREVDLSNCGIQEISMDAFMGCKKLEIINLAHNNLSYIPPGLFDDQRSLEEIYLEGNKLRTLPTSFFYQPKLKLARLNDNPWKCSCAMNNWLPKVTNQVRAGARKERCITDYISGKCLARRKVAHYKYDHLYAPRCENYNGRSVFYVMRKNLQCGQGRVVNIYSSRHRDKLRWTERDQRVHKMRQLHERRQERYVEKLEHKKQMYSDHSAEKSSLKLSNDMRENLHLTWQTQEEQKVRHSRERENSIAHRLRKNDEKKQSVRNISDFIQLNKEISNEI